MEKSSSVCRRLRHLLQHKTTAKSAVAAAAPPSKPLGKYEILVERFKKNSRNSGFRWKHLQYAIIVRRLAEARRFSDIDDILQHQKQYPDIKEEVFTARLITLYGKAKMLDHALQLFDEMPDLNCPRTVFSFNTLLAACLHSKNFDKVIELFQELPAKLSIEPNVISYSSAIKAFCRKGSFENAVSLVEEMAEKGVAPNVVTFDVLLTECYYGGGFSEGERVWRLMEEKKIEADMRCYNARIHGLVSEKRLGEAVEIVKEMEQKELQGSSSYTYNLLIKGFINEGNVEEVKKWFAALQSPNIYTYVALVPFALHEMEDIDFAYKLCKDCVGVKGKVSATVLRQVIDRLLKDSKLDQAQQLKQLHNL